MTLPRENETLTETFSRVADEAYPERSPYFRTDEERRTFLRVINRDQADRRPLLRGQRLRIYRSRLREYWREKSENFYAALIVLACLGLMALPAETALEYLVNGMSVLGLFAFVWLVSDIKRDGRKQ